MPITAQGALPLMRFTRSSQRAFTAVEVAMVASVIAILALLILPIFRQRAEEAKVTAANDEIQSLVKALILIEADLPGGNFLPQLNDLDNRENPPADRTLAGFDPIFEPATSFWNRVTGQFEITTIPTYNATVRANWRGPYIAVRNTKSLSEIAASYPLLTANGANDGPITIFGNNGFTFASDPYTSNASALDNDRYPVDPWGTPYLLYGPETVYNVRLLLSLGPNATPGNNTTPGTADFNRPNMEARYKTGAGGDDQTFFF